MDNDGHRTGLEEAASAGKTAADAARIGKAISKGTAAGGAWGAVAAAAIEGREYIGKLLTGAAILLLLPVLFILMLPSLIFGGLTESGTEGNVLPVLNDSAAISAHYDAAASSVNQILNEGIEDAKTRIAEHFATTEGDHYEVINPYEDGLGCNVNIFFSEYCSAKNEAWSEIALTDMESILRAAKDQMFSFTYTMETRAAEADDPDAEEDAPSEDDSKPQKAAEAKTELWYIYTISYNGEASLADAVFHLTEQQKALADDYAKNLSLFLGDGAYQGPTAYNLAGSIPSLGNVIFTDGETDVVYYNQYDERYANKAYGTDNVGHYGCGPSSMAIVVSSLTSDRQDPAQMAEWAYQHGYWCKGHGSYRSLIPGAAKAWGLSVDGCGKDEPQRIVDALNSGKLVVAIMSKGHFTSGGHFIVLRGVKDGKIMVADPASRSRSEKLWDLSLIISEASSGRDSGGPFWLIGRTV